MSAEITQGAIADIGDWIGRRSRLRAVIADNSRQSKKVIIDVLIHAIHRQHKRIPDLQISAIVKKWSPDIFFCRRPCRTKQAGQGIHRQKNVFAIGFA
jgi:hypothetical protein